MWIMTKDGWKRIGGELPPMERPIVVGYNGEQTRTRDGRWWPFGRL